MNDLLGTALAVNQDNLALANETFAVPGGRFVRNQARPSIWDANHVDRITAASPLEIEALLGRARREYAHCERLRFDVDPRTPPEFEARLQLEPEYRRSETLVMVLEGEPRDGPKPFEIRPITDEAGWRAFNALRALDWAEGQRRLEGSGVTALLHHCVRDCRAQGAGPVVIVADAADTPKRMYAAMGWRPLAVLREYRLSR